MSIRWHDERSLRVRSHCIRHREAPLREESLDVEESVQRRPVPRVSTEIFGVIRYIGLLRHRAAPDVHTCCAIRLFAETIT